MARKRITQIFPFLLPLRVKQRKLFFYLKMRFDRNRYSKRADTIYSISTTRYIT